MKTNEHHPSQPGSANQAGASRGPTGRRAARPMVASPSPRSSTLGSLGPAYAL
ncbi:hypothetical protein [Hymenobacter sp. BT559]|uniref:hypothetical protein n=1 Tax=Hymenobacter sp. BT559 TaxID=2795729 RepID=UPI0018ED8C30|nr:hypothetical protein [Hymenobacter sp. BT559]MBJ6143982.1 hypothetical protein [Hymenobacter sp. BT559]